MKILRTLIIFLALPMAMMSQTLTLDECQRLAQENYPLIKRYSLIEQTTSYTLQNISKGWLPQLSASAQATLQSDVMSFPNSFKNIMAQTGQELKGLSKSQYRVGIDLNQMVYDGGSISNQRKVAQLQGDVQKAQNEVDLYAIRQRVNDIFFSILLTDERLKVNEDLQTLLEANLSKLNSMLRNGLAMESDVSSMKAEHLKAKQQYTELISTRQSLCHMLSAFIGEEVTNVSKPLSQPLIPSGNNRPELRLLESQLDLAHAQEKLLDTSLMPKLSIFAQGFYGYPGYNTFEDMFSRKWSLNGMVGARLTWNISQFYTNKGDKAKLQLQRQQTENARETFLFNNKLKQMQQNEAIEKYRQLMKDDESIVVLRKEVRQAAESKLAHGIIDTNALLQEINRENQAKIELATHEVEMLQQIENLKLTLNADI
ncbi:MAG: TolC family protein [Bacteroidaceae bacterium]|nr:TolC family protein [Bacteroidaceae bacterium]